MRSPLSAQVLLWLSIADRAISSPYKGSQQVLAPPADDKEASATHAEFPTEQVHVVDDAILAALDTYPDPIQALKFLQPESAAELLEPRLIDVFGSPKPVWMTEGEKLRLRRDGKKFMDITDHQDLYLEPLHSLSGKASTHHPS